MASEAPGFFVSPDGKEQGAPGVKAVSDDNSSTHSNDHIFKDEATAKYWRNVYEENKYEGRHRFDPNYTWTPEEEKKLVRKVRQRPRSPSLQLTSVKIDLRITFWAWLMFCALDLNRKNINRAISDNMLPELGMNTNDFNYGQTVSHILRQW